MYNWIPWNIAIVTIQDVLWLHILYTCKPFVSHRNKCCLISCAISYSAIICNVYTPRIKINNFHGIFTYKYRVYRMVCEQPKIVSFYKKKKMNRKYWIASGNFLWRISKVFDKYLFCIVTFFLVIVSLRPGMLWVFTIRKKNRTYFLR